MVDCFDVITSTSKRIQCTGRAMGAYSVLLTDENGEVFIASISRLLLMLY